ncbi:glycosyltransferase family 4 protein [Paenarthrobacter sp. NPDC090522]|uniref:glycosyltransferase family 4 protein n=1 Tax=Paenarthrobacter sp. NPDC090522 TaxID=3364383 RepID=UPI00382BDB3D
MTFFKNVMLACGVVADHLNESPIFLAIQIVRKFPSRLVRPLARLLGSCAPSSGRTVFLLASYLSGDTKGLQRRFENAQARGVRGNKARWAAEVAVAAGQPDWADVFLAQSKPAKRLPATLARRQWYAGDMSGAVETLKDQPRSLAKQRRRFESELEVFRGWRPVLPPSTPIVSRPLRVLHLLTNSVPHTNSGYARRSHSVLKAQQKAGWETLAVTRLGYPVQVGELTARRRDLVDGVQYERLLPAKMAPYMDGRLQQQSSALITIARHFRPSVLHTTTHFVNGIVAREVAEALDIPWVYEVRGHLADTWASSRDDLARFSERYELFQQREAEIMRSADLVVTLGDAMKRNIVASGVPESRVLLTPNAVGGSYLDEPLSHSDARRALGLEPNGLYFGTVSSLVDYEGLDDLISAFALLAPKLPKLVLVLVGDGVAAPSLRSQVQDLGLSARTIIPGRVSPESARLYHAALDVFVVPRKDLPVTQAVTPLKPIEALASARPVVASNLAALREIVLDGVNGRLARPEDPKALAEVVAELLCDANLRKQMGNAGRERVLTTRTWRANAKAYDTAYKSLGA